MIQNKIDYKLYFSADLISSGKRFTLLNWLKDPVLRYLRLLRKLEYYLNCKKGSFGRLIVLYFRYRLVSLSYSLGMQIPPNVFGPGLAVIHYQGIIVSANAKVGKNCRIHAGVNIGEWKGKAPIVGDNVYLGPGAKLVGNITIGDRSVVGANAVVCKDIPSDVTIGGVPAKIISNNNSSDIIIHPGAK